MPDGPSLWIPSSLCAVTKMTAISLCVVALILLGFWHPLSGPCMEVPFTCSSALIPHNRSPFNMDTLPKLLWLWHLSSGSCSLWISYSFPLGSDFQLWATPLCGHPWYSSWVLIPCLRLLLKTLSPHTGCSPMWTTFLTHLDHRVSMRVEGMLAMMRY